MNRYLKIGTNMVWPLPEKIEECCIWKIKYAPDTLSDADRHYLASVATAYAQLIGDPEDKRRVVISELRRAIK